MFVKLCILFDVKNVVWLVKIILENCFVVKEFGIKDDCIDLNWVKWRKIVNDR